MEDRWLTFANFYEDVQSLNGYNEWYNNPKEYAFDKDYLQRNVPKNLRVYSRTTCCFIPNRLNWQLEALDNGNRTGYYGVQLNKQIYYARIKENNKKFTIGGYRTAEQAAAAVNNYIEYYYPYLIPNDVPRINPIQLNKLDVHKKEMCKIINPDKPRKYPLMIHDGVIQLAPPIEMCRIIEKQ